MMRHWALIGAAALAACGGSGTATTTAPASTFPDPVVTISANGLAPAQVHMNLTQPVQFVNRDAAAHTLVPAPDLGYGECADIARLGTIEAGQTRTLALQHEGICALRDGAHPANPAYQVLLIAH